jgi:RIO kinase 1
VLYWDGACKIIDFPQMVDPRANPEAFDIFRRDVTRLCEYFARYGIHANGRQLAGSIWARKGPDRNVLSDGAADSLGL